MFTMSEMLFKQETSLTNNGWQKLVEKSLEWRIISVPETDIKYMVTAVCDKIKDKNSAFGYTHENCRITFLTKVDQSVNGMVRNLNLVTQVKKKSWVVMRTQDLLQKG